MNTFRTKASILCLSALLALAMGCTRQNDVSSKESVQKSLEQAELKDVSVSEDISKNTVTLGGTLHSDDAKQKAGDVAKAAAPNRVIVNEISVQPVGFESQAKDISSNLDDGIQNNYKAALIASGLDKQDISYDVKNGVIMLKGKVVTPQQRQQAQTVAENIPNVQQVVNEIQVKR